MTVLKAVERLTAPLRLGAVEARTTMPENNMTSPLELINALNTTFGRHKGFRASHAKGFAVTGCFVPAVDAPSIDIPLLCSKQPVVARFSVGGGKPNMSDKSPSVRGVGLTIGRGDVGWSLAMISAPVFFANSAEQFKEFLAARVPDPTLGVPDPEKVTAFNAANPNTVPHQAFLKNTPPCRCYSAEAYHSGHAYRFARGQDEIFARIILEPEGGRRGLTEEEKASFSDDFLHDAFVGRLTSGPARWSLKLIVATTDDDVSDPTCPWEGAHDEITLGTLWIEQPDFSEMGQARVFDPSFMPLGVLAPRDNVFLLRSPAYAISAARRAK